MAGLGYRVICSLGKESRMSRGSSGSSTKTELPGTGVVVVGL